MSVKEAQTVLQGLLQNKLIDCNEVTEEWRTEMAEGLYSPRLDVAVGPFAKKDGVRLLKEYDELFKKNEPFIKELVEIHVKNILPEIDNDQLTYEINKKIRVLTYFNENSRCFIAIEIENAVSRKHLMGGALNAVALGRIAIAVGFNEEKHRAFLRLYKYNEFLGYVEKPFFPMHNLLIISHTQLINFLNSWQKRR